MKLHENLNMGFFCQIVSRKYIEKKKNLLFNEMSKLGTEVEPVPDGCACERVVQ